MAKTISEQLAEKTLRELEGVEKPLSHSRVWKTAQGYKFLIRSLEEVKGDIERWLQDGFLASVKGSNLNDLGVGLKTWNTWAGNPINSSKILSFPLKPNKGNYRSLKEIRGKDLNYEIFMELINKTDWLLRRLVASLEKKLEEDKLELGGIRKF